MIRSLGLIILIPIITLLTQAKAAHTTNTNKESYKKSDLVAWPDQCLESNPDHKVCYTKTNRQPVDLKLPKTAVFFNKETVLEIHSSNVFRLVKGQVWFQTEKSQSVRINDIEVTGLFWAEIVDSKTRLTLFDAEAAFQKEGQTLKVSQDMTLLDFDQSRTLTQIRAVWLFELTDKLSLLTRSTGYMQSLKAAADHKAESSEASLEFKKWFELLTEAHDFYSDIYADRVNAAEEQSKLKRDEQQRRKIASEGEARRLRDLFRKKNAVPDEGL